MRQRIYVFLLLITPLVALGQESLFISGVVKDSLLNTPVEGANIYLSGTSKGTSSDKDGNFKIEDLKPGNYTLVISHTAYEFSIIDVLLLNASKALGTVPLTEDLIESGIAEVVGKRDKVWQRRFKRFKSMIMGGNFEEHNIEIVNAYDADFLKLKDGGLAKEKPFKLEIINRYTGYRIFYEIQQFYLGKKYAPFITGYSQFKKLEPRDEAEERYWLRNRQEAYSGSLRHFFENLIVRSHDNSGFKAYIDNGAKVERIDVFEKKNISRRPIHGSNLPGRFEIEDTTYPYIKKITFKDYLYFEYQNASDDNGDPQKTWIKAKNDGVFVFGNGILLDPTMVTLSGFLAGRRLYEMLPFDFELDH